MATLYLKAAGGNFSAAGTWSNTGSGGGDSSGPPTAADNLILESGSGNLTLDANGACRSLDCTSGTGTYAGTITHNAAVTLSIGDGSAGAGNVALKFTAGMTYNFSNATTSIISFVSTVTGNTITTAGKNICTLTIAGVGGGWTLQDSLTQSTASVTLTVTNGAFNTNGQTLAIRTLSSSNSNTRTVDLTNSSVTLASNTPVIFSTTTNLTFVSTGSTITCNGSSLTFAGGGLTYNIVAFTGAGSAAITGANTFGTLTRTGTAAKTDSISWSTTQTFSGTLNLNGNSATNRLLVQSDTIGSARTLVNNAGTTSITNADFRDITGSGSASWNLSAITGGSGDCGGNSGITFTTATTRYWVGGTGNWSSTGEWSTSSGGASGASVPLPQDDVVFDANSFSAGSQTVTQDMPRMGKSINWTGATNNPTWSITTANQTLYGSLTLISAMTLTQSQVLIFEGRGAFTLTSAGKSFGGGSSSTTIAMVGGTLTLQDAFTSTSSVTLNNGTLDTNGMSVTSTTFVSSGSATRTLTLGSSNWTITGVGSVWSAAASMTLTAGMTGAILITDTSSTSKTFIGASKTYNDVTITAGGTGAVIFTNANTFRTLTIAGGPKTITFPSATTTTIKRLIAMGSSGNVITITSSTGASAATISQTGGVTAGDWMSLQDITFSASSGALFYAGANSTSVSGNTNIIFKTLTAMNAADFGGW